MAIESTRDLCLSVADAIREKKGSSELINPQDFAKEIASIEGGGSGEGGGGGQIEYLCTSNIHVPQKAILSSLSDYVKVFDYEQERYPIIGASFGALDLLGFDSVDYSQIDAIAIDLTRQLHVEFSGEQINISILDTLEMLGIPKQLLNSIIRLTKEEFYSTVYKYVPGCFIQHINGSLYSKDEWMSKGFSNEDANGVYSSDGNQAIIIAKHSLGEIAWSSKPNTLIEDALSLPNSDLVEFPYTGKEDTAQIASFDTNSAASKCLEYIFPNGQKGYLPSPYYISFCSNVDEYLELIGGTPMGNTYLWSSTQYDAENAWVRRVNGPYDLTWFPKNSNMQCRPICDFIPNNSNLNA